MFQSASCAQGLGAGRIGVAFVAGALCMYTRIRPHRQSVPHTCSAPRHSHIHRYLATPEEGGETVFPDAAVQSTNLHELSQCAQKGLANKPYKVGGCEGALHGGAHGAAWTRVCGAYRG